MFDNGTGPSVVETSPGAGATVPPDTSVTATFDEAVDPAPWWSTCGTAAAVWWPVP